MDSSLDPTPQEAIEIEKKKKAQKKKSMPLGEFLGESSPSKNWADYDLPTAPSDKDNGGGSGYGRDYDRDGRGGFERRDRRGGYDRDNRGGYDRDNRGGYDRDNNRDGYDRDRSYDRPTRGGYDRGGFDRGYDRDRRDRGGYGYDRDRDSHRGGGGYDRGYDRDRGGYDRDYRGGGGGRYDSRGHGGSSYGGRRGGGSFSRDRNSEPREPREPRERRPVPTEPPFTAYIGNFSFKSTEDSIKDFLEGCNVKSVRLISDGAGRLKGYGYVEFDDLDSLMKALSLDGIELDERSLRIDVADGPNEKKQDDRTNVDSWRRATPLERTPADARPSESYRPKEPTSSTSEQRPEPSKEPSKPKSNPFGDAKPVDDREILRRAEEKAKQKEEEIKRQLELERAEKEKVEKPEKSEKSEKSEKPRKN